MRSLRWRIRVVLVVVCVAVALAMALVVLTPLVWRTLERTAQVFEAVPDGELARCDRDPVVWRYQSRRGVSAWALDPQTLQPLNPESPPVSILLRMRLAAGEEQPVVLANEGGGGALALRRSGRCELVMVTWPIDGQVGRSLMGSILAVLAGSTIFTVWIGWWVVLRPLTRSLTELDRASRSIGEETYQPPNVEQEMAAVGAALDQANARVFAERERSLQERRTIERHIADVSHDLRSPLASLQLRLERIAAEPTDVDAVRGALEDVSYLGMLSENLATSGQLRSGLRDVEGAVDVGSVAQRVAARFAVLGRRVQIEVVPMVPDAPVWVAGPAVYVEQILANLVHNAVRHHDGSGTVLVLVEPGDTVVVQVCDDGPGDPLTIPDRRGRGLGLNIVRQLVAHLGGSLTFTAAEPRGLIATLRLGPGLAGQHRRPDQR